MSQDSISIIRATRLIFPDLEWRSQGSKKNQKTRCVFHEEQSPSFYARPLSNRFQCYGCGLEGGVGLFVQECYARALIADPQEVFERVSSFRRDDEASREWLRRVLVREQLCDRQSSLEERFEHYYTSRFLDALGLLKRSL